MINIIYVGDLTPGGTCLMRMNALRRIGCSVTGIDLVCGVSGACKLADRVFRRVGVALDWHGCGSTLIAGVRLTPPDIVWIDKGLTISPAVLAEVRAECPAARLVHYSPDDMSGRHNRSIKYRRAIPFYDLHVTTKSYCVAELKNEGARDVLFLNNAFCPETHRPVTVSVDDRKKYGGSVGFIGYFEESRAEYIMRLAQASVPVRVWGSGWDRWADSHTHPSLRIERRTVEGLEYSATICSFDVNLGFLRKLNRDLQTTRTVEIPACGGFLLAERTAEQQTLFEEGVEAEYFGSFDELLAKCQFYLANQDRRLAIAKAAQRRCMNSDYSYDGHVRAIVEHALGRPTVREREANGSRR